MKRDVSNRQWENGPHMDGRHGNVHISYTCGALNDDESLCLVKDLVDSAVELLLNKTCLAAEEKGPIKICVEHCQKRYMNDALLGDLRYLKVYVEGHAPCVVMAY